jgi:heme-based aerotactic transducer
MDADPSVERQLPPDPDVLLERVGLDGEAIARRRAAIGLDDSDAKRLSELQPVLRERRATVLEMVTDALDSSGDGGAGRNGTAPDGGGRDASGDGGTEVGQTGADGAGDAGADADTPSPVPDRLERTWRTELTGLGRGSYGEDFASERAEVALETDAADVPLSKYFAVHGRTYDRVFADLEARVVGEIEDRIEAWAAEEADAGNDGGGVLGGLTSAVGGSDDEAEREERIEGLQASIREAVADGLADAGALARVGALDAGIAADATTSAYERRVERARDRRAAILADLQSDVAEPLGNVHETAGSVADSAGTITDLAGAQAEEVPAAAADLDDLSATVEEVAATAEEVRDASAETEQRADDGLASAREAVDEMEAVRGAIEGLVTVVDELEERAERIDSIARGINDVASRSKVLASNAQAQANRDVDARRSLEVLSEEISAFADETRQELGELPAEVTALQEVAAAVGQQVERADERVTDAGDRVAAVETEIEAMAAAAETTASHMDEVAAATDRQATASESISESVDRLARRSQQIAAETESIAAATEEQTAALGEVVEQTDRLQRTHGMDDPAAE